MTWIIYVNQIFFIKIKETNSRLIVLMKISFLISIQEIIRSDLTLGDSLKKLPENSECIPVKLHFDEVFIQRETTTDGSQNLIFQYDISSNNHNTTSSTKRALRALRDLHIHQMDHRVLRDRQVIA